MILVMLIKILKTQVSSETKSADAVLSCDKYAHTWIGKYELLANESYEPVIRKATSASLDKIWRRNLTRLQLVS